MLCGRAENSTEKQSFQFLLHILTPSSSCSWLLANICQMAHSVTTAFTPSSSPPGMWAVARSRPMATSSVDHDGQARGRTTDTSRVRVGRRAVLPLLLTVAIPPLCAQGESRGKESDEFWRKNLTTEQYQVLRRGGTERAFSSSLNNENRDGKFCCVGCGQVVFDMESKFDSGTGWPSFYEAVSGGVRLKQTAMDWVLRQREVVCARCEGHLGHVFGDGPQPTGLRFCINGVALRFQPRNEA